MMPTPPAKPRWWKRKAWLLPVWAWIVVGIIGLGAVGAATDKKDKNSAASDATVATTIGAPDATDSTDSAATSTTAAPTTTALPPTTPAPTTTAAPTTTVPPTTTTTTEPAPTTTELPFIDDGVYIVGSEIQPGVYRVGSYWARLDANQEIIDNDITSGCPTIMVVQPTDAFVKITGQAISVDAVPSFDPTLANCTQGTYLVGPDIQPGTYKVLPEDGNAYWARLDGALQTIDNDIGDGQLIVIVKKSDFALKVSGTLQPA